MDWLFLAGAGVLGGLTGSIAGLASVATYPALAQQLLDGEGELNRFVNVFLNETDVRHLGGLDAPVGDRDQVLLLPAMAGG